MRRRMVGTTRVSRILTECAGIDFEVPVARSKKLTNQWASGDMRRHGQKPLDIFIQVLSTPIRDGIGDMGDGPGHEG